MSRSLPLLIVAVLAGFAVAQGVPPNHDPNGPDSDTKRAPVEKPIGEKGVMNPNGNGNPQAKPLPPGAPAPKIACAKPQFDFGEAGQNEDIIHDYEIENVGKADLEIISTHGSCGCTAVAPDKKLLKPGEKGMVNVNLKTLANQGTISKTITVTTNDPVTPSYVLTISGKVTQPFRPAVTELNFGTLKKTAKVEPKTFEVLTNSSQSIVEIKTDNPQVTATYELLPVEQKKQGYLITVKIDGTLPVGQLRSIVSIGTTVASQKTIAIPVLATVEGEVNVKPRTFNWGKVKRGDAGTKIVEIEKKGDADLKLESVQVKPEGAFTATVEEVKPGQSYRIVLGIAKDAKDGYSRGTVNVKTNCPGETDLQIYFYALLQS
jgi:hypothetical protein